MSQRKAKAEQKLESLENSLGHGGRIRKLLEIVAVKVRAGIVNPTVRQTALDDLEEAEMHLKAAQDEIARLIKQLGL